MIKVKQYVIPGVTFMDELINQTGILAYSFIILFFVGRKHKNCKLIEEYATKNKTEQEECLNYMQNSFWNSTRTVEAFDKKLKRMQELGCNGNEMKIKVKCLLDKVEEENSVYLSESNLKGFFQSKKKEILDSFNRGNIINKVKPENTLSILPDEILDLIVSKVDNMRDIINLSMVNKRLNYTCKNCVSNSLIHFENKVGNLKHIRNFNKHIRIHVEIRNNDELESCEAFENVYSLTLESCHNVRDVSMLGNLHTIKITDSYELSDVSALGRVKNLDLSGCTGITDVSALGRVKNLNLSGCTGITDVSALGNVHTLNLSNCTISNVSELGRVHTLNLSRCRNITNVSALSNVHTLNLSECEGIENFSMLGNVYDLTLAGCNITDAFPFAGVHKLNLSYSYDLVDVSMLGDVYDLDLSFCESIEDVSALGRVHKLNLYNCIGVTDVSALENVYELNIIGTSVTDVSMLSNVRVLEFDDEREQESDTEEDEDEDEEEDE